MRTATLVNHLDRKELQKRMKLSGTKEQFQRWQSIFLTYRGLSSTVVAEYVGTTPGTVHQWVFEYNHNGPDGFILQGRGGRRFGLLTIDEERDLLDKARSTAQKGRILTAGTLRAMVEDVVGNTVSKDYLYDILHRHGWRKVMPRPQHPKADEGKQEEFKKNSRSWWQPPKKTSTRKTSDR